MTARRAPGFTSWARSARPSFLVLLAFLALVALAGGASRADTLGQAFVRGGALIAGAGWILLGARPDWRRHRAILLILLAAAALVAAQLVPLPWGLWAGTPGRALFAEVAGAVGLAGGWRPLALVPDGAVNALFSLLVPLATLAGVSTLGSTEVRRLLPALLATVALSALVSLFQLSSGRVDNPLINDSLGLASGLFANRNHQALFLSIGVLAALGWGFDPARRLGWRSVSALGLVPFLVLMIIATGSRAGLGLCAVALVVGAAIAVPALRRAGRRLPRWTVPGAVAGAAVVLALLLFVSVAAGRGTSIDRLFAVDVGADMRTRALPTLWDLIARFFPLGSGAGSFDAMFRMAEPFELLKPTYFNHAHNDYLEVLLEFGAPGVLLVAAAIGWWALASWRAWRAPAEGGVHGRVGSVAVLLVLLSSAVDYPARTPLVMAVLVLAAAWMTPSRERARG